MTGSDLYGVSRLNFKNNNISDYWTASTVANTNALKLVIDDLLFDILIIETHSEHFFNLSKLKNKYKIIFKNKLGFIAKLK